jgi:predicted GNAT family N-acyltransferase
MHKVPDFIRKLPTFYRSVQQTTLPIEIISGTAEALFTETYKIRSLVFVEEQNVPEDEEKDEYEAICRHYLATLAGEAMGTARWRKTDKGIKLERFAVIANARKKGVGAAIAKQVLQDILIEYPEKSTIYCHAQVSALAFWESQGFVAEGEVFYEANIAHYLMKYAAK